MLGRGRPRIESAQAHRSRGDRERRRARETSWWERSPPVLAHLSDGRVLDGIETERIEVWSRATSTCGERSASRARRRSGSRRSGSSSTSTIRLPPRADRLAAGEDRALLHGSSDLLDRRPSTRHPPESRSLQGGGALPANPDRIDGRQAHEGSRDRDEGGAEVGVADRASGGDRAIAPEIIAPVTAPSSAPTIPAQKRSGTKTVKSQSASPTVEHTTRAIRDSSRASFAAVAGASWERSVRGGRAVAASSRQGLGRLRPVRSTDGRGGRRRDRLGSRGGWASARFGLHRHRAGRGPHRIGSSVPTRATTFSSGKVGTRPISSTSRACPAR